MKCKDLKDILADIDGDVEIAFHIFGQNIDATEFLSLVDDKVHDRTIIWVATNESVI